LRRIGARTIFRRRRILSWCRSGILVGTLSDEFAPFWPPNDFAVRSRSCALPTLVALHRLFIPGARHRDWEWGMAWPQLLAAFATNCAVAVLNACGVFRAAMVRQFLQRILFG
jgi:hypothetical protein